MEMDMNACMGMMGMGWVLMIAAGVVFALLVLGIGWMIGRRTGHPRSDSSPSDTS